MTTLGHIRPVATLGGGDATAVTLIPALAPTMDASYSGLVPGLYPLAYDGATMSILQIPNATVPQHSGLVTVGLPQQIPQQIIFQPQQNQSERCANIQHHTVVPQQTAISTQQRWIATAVQPQQQWVTTPVQQQHWVAALPAALPQQPTTSAQPAQFCPQQYGGFLLGAHQAVGTVQTVPWGQGTIVRQPCVAGSVGVPSGQQVLPIGVLPTAYVSTPVVQEASVQMGQEEQGRQQYDSHVMRPHPRTSTPPSVQTVRGNTVISNNGNTATVAPATTTARVSKSRERRRACSNNGNNARVCKKKACNVGNCVEGSGVNASEGDEGSGGERSGAETIASDASALLDLSDSRRGRRTVKASTWSPRHEYDTGLESRWCVSPTPPSSETDSVDSGNEGKSRDHFAAGQPGQQQHNHQNHVQQQQTQDQQYQQHALHRFDSGGCSDSDSSREVSQTTKAVCSRKLGDFDDGVAAVASVGSGDIAIAAAPSPPALPGLSDLSDIGEDDTVPAGSGGAGGGDVDVVCSAASPSGLGSPSGEGLAARLAEGVVGGLVDGGVPSSSFMFEDDGDSAPSLWEPRSLDSDALDERTWMEEMFVGESPVSATCELTVGDRPNSPLVDTRSTKGKSVSTGVNQGAARVLGGVAGDIRVVQPQSPEQVSRTEDGTAPVTAAPVVIAEGELPRTPRRGVRGRPPKSNKGRNSVPKIPLTSAVFTAVKKRRSSVSATLDHSMDVCTDAPAARVGDVAARRSEESPGALEEGKMRGPAGPSRRRVRLTKKRSHSEPPTTSYRGIEGDEDVVVRGDYGDEVGGYGIDDEDVRRVGSFLFSGDDGDDEDYVVPAAEGESDTIAWRTSPHDTRAARRAREREKQKEEALTVSRGMEGKREKKDCGVRRAAVRAAKRISAVLAGVNTKVEFPDSGGPGDSSVGRTKEQEMRESAPEMIGGADDGPEDGEGEGAGEEVIEKADDVEFRDRGTGKVIRKEVEAEATAVDDDGATKRRRIAVDVTRRRSAIRGRRGEVVAKAAAAAGSDADDALAAAAPVATAVSQRSEGIRDGECSPPRGTIGVSPVDVAIATAIAAAESVGRNAASFEAAALLVDELDRVDEQTDDEDNRHEENAGSPKRARDGSRGDEGNRAVDDYVALGFDEAIGTGEIPIQDEGERDEWLDKMLPDDLEDFKGWWNDGD
nr:protein m18 [Mastomys natalensis cytomegalovirus 3]